MALGISVTGRLQIDAYEDGVTIKVGEDTLYTSWRQHSDALLSRFSGKRVLITVTELDDALPSET